MMNQKAIALGERTDFGSMTVLFNKLSSLLILNPQSKEEWKYVKPEPGCTVISLGVTLVKLANGRLTGKSRWEVFVYLKLFGY